MLYHYVDTDLDDNLICCICRTPFNEPVTTRTCFHTFCQGCILQALSVSNHCPIDRSPLSVELLGQADPIVRHLVEELDVKCPNVDAGCEYTGERHLLGSHLKLQCPHAQVPCPCSDEGCKRTVTRKDILEGETFVHGEPCPESGDTQTMTCKFCEQGFTDVSTLKDHLDTTCPDTTIPCSQAENGCTWKGRRLSLETHVDKCPYESIKGFFSLHKTNMGQLSKENERLRRRTDELEGLVRILRKELDWVKIVLEPWYRPVYPERPSMTINCDQYPNNDGPGSGPGSRRAGPTHLQGMDLIAGDASNLAPRVENGVTEGVDIFDPFSFLGRTQNHAPNVRTGNDVPLTTALAGAEPSPSPSVHTSSRAVEPRESQNLGTTQGPSPSGPGSTRDAAVLSPRTNEVQSTSITPLPDHFPPENREVFEDGSLSQPRGWSHLPPLNSMSSNPSPSIQIPNQPPTSGSIHSHPGLSHTYNRPQFTPSINKHAVAPLNLSTTVEGSLVGLRESLVTLSEALESQGRRLELALATEGLRVSEEVGSLKAIIQGLRMQVHAVMVDRNALVTGRIGGVLNVPPNLGVRPQYFPGPGGEEESKEGPRFPVPEENGRYSPGNGGLFPPQQPVPPGVTMPMMGQNFLIGPMHPSVRLNYMSQGGAMAGGGMFPPGGLGMGSLSPHHLYMLPTAGSGPKL